MVLGTLYACAGESAMKLNLNVACMSLTELHCDRFLTRDTASVSCLLHVRKTTVLDFQCTKEDGRLALPDLVKTLKVLNINGIAANS